MINVFGDLYPPLRGPSLVCTRRSSSWHLAPGDRNWKQKYRINVALIILNRTERDQMLNIYWRCMSLFDLYIYSVKISDRYVHFFYPFLYILQNVWLELIFKLFQEFLEQAHVAFFNNILVLVRGDVKKVKRVKLGSIFLKMVILHKMNFFIFD